MSWNGEVSPATIAQVRAGAKGEFITIEEDVCGVAEDLRGIDPRLRLRWSKAGQYFVVYAREDWEPEGTGHLVGTYQELDQRVVRDIEETYYKWRLPGFSFADELEEKEAKDKKDDDHASLEETGPYAEKLAFALRRDLNLNKDTAFISKEIPSGNS